MSKTYFDETHCAIGHPKSTFMQWMLTIDHKRIGIMYAAVMFVFFFVAVFTAFAMRLELFAPGGQYMDGDTFNQAFTLHGVIMIFLFIIPGIPAIFGNIVMPLMIGAKDVSFPRLNWFTFWLYIAGCCIALASLFIGEGVADTGWTFYAPYSMNTGTNVIMALVAAFVLGFASILTGLNFLVTIHRLRAPGMTFFKMPLFVWGIYATAWIQLLATPVVGITLVLAILEKYFGIGIFDPAKGGDPVLFQHLFWIYSHPAVYLMILPAFGIMSEIIPTFSRKEVFGYRTIALSSASIAGIGYLVWGHHLYTSGMSDIAKTVFSFLTFFVAIPTGVKFYDWVATMYQGKIVLSTPMIWALGTIITFAIGGITGITITMIGMDVHLQDTYYTVAHFHYAILGGVVFLMFAGMHYWFPLITGKMYNETKAKIAFYLNFIGFNLLWFPMFIAGYYGMPRRYFDYLPEFEIYHQISFVGAVIFISGLIYMFWVFFKGWTKGEATTPNPWNATTLEWHLPSSPPPLENHSKVPYVDFDPYEYKNGEPVVKFNYETMQKDRLMGHEYVPEIATDRDGNQHEVQGWQGDFYGGKLGFWLFMLTEVMMFGAMFLALAYYNTLHPQDFLDASASLNRLLGGTNTVILLVSALTMGLGLLRMRAGDVKGAKLMIWATIILAVAFLVIKGFEWTAEYHHGIFLMHDKLLPESSLPFGQKLFFGLYFSMTGLHGFHIIIGIGLMLWLLKRINAGKVSTEHHILHWNIALYWDIVHLIWVFVFPYYYMIGAGGATGGH